MQSVRINTRLPTLHRVYRAAPQQTRNMPLFYPRFVVNEFAPALRLFDELQAVSRCQPTRKTSIQKFQPRFDVKETETAYELFGELPGVEQKDLQVEFTSPNTLQIKGRSERYHEQGTRPSTAAAAAVESQTEQPAAVEAAPSETETETSSNYHKPTVEDDFEEVTAEDATPAESTAEETPAAAQPEAPAQEVAQPQEQVPKGHYWVSERSVGSFARSFQFSRRVDQENVKASLKEGILSIVVPKAVLPENRRISVE